MAYLLLVSKNKTFTFFNVFVLRIVKTVIFNIKKLKRKCIFSDINMKLPTCGDPTVKNGVVKTSCFINVELLLWLVM